jgi:hypothetical protein
MVKYVVGLSAVNDYLMGGPAFSDELMILAISNWEKGTRCMVMPYGTAPGV